MHDLDEAARLRPETETAAARLHSQHNQREMRAAMRNAMRTKSTLAVAGIEYERARIALLDAESDYARVPWRRPGETEAAHVGRVVDWLRSSMPTIQEGETQAEYAKRQIEYMGKVMAAGERLDGARRALARAERNVQEALERYDRPPPPAPPEPPSSRSTASAPVVGSAEQIRRQSPAEKRGPPPEPGDVDIFARAHELGVLP